MPERMKSMFEHLAYRRRLNRAAKFAYARYFWGETPVAWEDLDAAEREKWRMAADAVLMIETVENMRQDREDCEQPVGSLDWVKRGRCGGCGRLVYAVMGGPMTRLVCDRCMGPIEEVEPPDPAAGISLAEFLRACAMQDFPPAGKTGGADGRSPTE